MITFKKLRFKGAATFDSKKRTTVPLHNQGVVTVLGNNKDSGGSNEAGKSALFYSIPNILFFTTPGGLSKKRKQITTGTYEATLEFDIDSKEYVITQYFAKTAGYKIIEDGQDVTPEGGINKCEGAISEIFPLTEEEYYSFVHVSPHKLHTLAKGKLAERLAFIHSVFSLDDFDYTQERLKEKANEVAKDLARFEDLDERLKQLKTRLESYPTIEEIEKDLKSARKKLKEAKENRAKSRSHEAELTNWVEARIQYNKLKKKLKALGSTSTSKSIEEIELEIDKAKVICHEWETHQDALRRFNKYKKYLSNNISDLEQTIEAFEESIRKHEQNNEFVHRRIRIEAEAAKLPKGNKKKLEKKQRELQKRIADAESTKKQATKSIDYYGSLDVPICPTCGQKIDRKKMREELAEAEKVLQEASDLLLESKRELEAIEKTIKLLERKQRLEDQIKDLPEGEIFDVKALKSKVRKKKKLLKKTRKAKTYKQSLKGFNITEQNYLNARQSLDVLQKDLDTARELENLKSQIEGINKPKESLSKLKKRLKETQELLDTLDRDVSLYDQKIVTLERDKDVVEQLTSDIEDYQAKTRKRNKTLQLKKIYDVLLQAYGPRGLKIDRIRLITKTLTEYVNDYAPILFSDPIEFSHLPEDELASVMFQRKNSKRVDVRHLSSGATRKFILALIPAMAKMVTPDKRTNMVILDEVDANIDRVGQSIFTDQFLPMLVNRFDSVFAVTPYENVIDGSSQWTVTKEKGVSRLRRKT